MQREKDGFFDELERQLGWKTTPVGGSGRAMVEAGGRLPIEPPAPVVLLERWMKDMGFKAIPWKDVAERLGAGEITEQEAVRLITERGREAHEPCPDCDCAE